MELTDENLDDLETVAAFAVREAMPVMIGDVECSAILALVAEVRRSRAALARVRAWAESYSTELITAEEHANADGLPANAIAAAGAAWGIRRTRDEIDAAIFAAASAARAGHGWRRVGDVAGWADVGRVPLRCARCGREPALTRCECPEGPSDGTEGSK